MTVNRQRLMAIVFWLAIVVIGWFAYAPALGGAFILDDVANLEDLRLIEDKTSALNFVLSGDAGPLGRPLALATFVPQADAWMQTAEPFLRVNIFIHLINACMLAWVLYRLSIASRIAEGEALVVAVAAAAIWLFMPLLGSASFMIIQRMTTLCAFFVLLALAGYLEARRSIEGSTKMALAGMSASLVSGSILAGFSKETGLLLPVLVLVMESTVLSPPRSISPSTWRAWKSVFLGLPTAAVLAYLVLQVPYSQEIVLKRDFTAWERLITESQILWKYLFDAFVPQPGQFGPFHDGYPVARTILHPVTLLAFSSWLVALAVAIFWRRRYPFFAFGVLWFIVGHLLESTFIPLELYFEHRNYLPIIGPAFALCTLIVRVPAPRKRFAYAGVSLYVLINAFVLFSLATLWGNPAESSRYWHRHFPESVRAVTMAAGYQIATEGPESTIKMLQELVAEKPEVGYLKLLQLNLSCIIGPQEDHDRIVTELPDLLKGVDINFAALTMLSQLLTTVRQVGCKDVNNDTIKQFANALLQNPEYRDNARYNQLHHQLMASILKYEGKIDQVISHLEMAIEYEPSSELNEMMVATYADAKKFGAARQFIEEARLSAPLHPFRHYVWVTKLDSLSHYVDEVERRVKP